MGNPLHKTTHKGTIGERLIQLRLLEFGVQAAQPIKDKGRWTATLPLQAVNTGWK